MASQPHSVIRSEEHSEALDRILRAVEKDKKVVWIEVVCAVLLSLATTASAWCAYEATLWSGEQTFELASASSAGRASSTAAMKATQARAFDASMFISYAEARSRGDEKLAEFLQRRFRPEMKSALQAWLQLDPLNNPAAPPSPFAMPEYRQEMMLESERQSRLAASHFDSAQRANEIADSYIMFTVLYTTVLLFAGLGATSGTHRIRLVMLIIASTVFAGTLILMTQMPLALGPIHAMR